MMMKRSALIALILTVALGITGAFAVTPTATRPTIPIPPVTITGTTYTLTKDDCERLLRFTASTTVTVTTLNSLPLGCRIRIAQSGVGQVIVADGAGATKSSAYGYSATFAQYAIIELTVDTNVGGTAAHILVQGDGAAPVVIVTAYYVSTTGNDSSAGTAAAPFATFSRARAAMRASGTIKTTYIRAGSYTPAAMAGTGSGLNIALALESPDNGTTWSYYPPDGYNTALISGGSISSGNGLHALIEFGDGANNITINGLTLHNFDRFGIIAYGADLTGSTPPVNLTIKNNIIYNGFYDTGDYNGARGIVLAGCTGCLISHNVVHTVQSMGISSYAYNLGNGGNISNLTYDGNVVYNTCITADDCGGLYVRDADYATAPSTNINITNNFVRDGNVSGGVITWLGHDNMTGSGIYLDDCVSNVTVSGNVITGASGGRASMIRGTNDKFTGNIVDLVSYQDVNIANWVPSPVCPAATMAGNTAQKNIVIGRGGGGGYTQNSDPPTAPAITNNSYWNYAGAAIDSSGCGLDTYNNGCYTDASPTTQNPQISGCYAVAPGSPVFNAPVLFPGITGGWGPPGYVIPAASGGSVPSYPSPTC